MKKNRKKYDIAVIGGGHAGIEAAVIAARMGLSTVLVTLDRSKIGVMSCNPAIGGLAKGQLVREIDALGGVMGKLIDEAGIHFKMLNTSKGPAVQSPRAQADRTLYINVSHKMISMTEHLDVIEDMATGVHVKSGQIRGIYLKNTGLITVRAAVLTAGTFLNGIIYIGMNKLEAGRAGEFPAKGMTESLNELGFVSDRLKTGTPPRLHRDTIDYSKTIIQEPDRIPKPFSYSTQKIEQAQVNCHITHTNLRTHEILKEGFDRSPMFTGRIKGRGPRYCPSIEDKVNRFADRERHQLFLEPEGYDNIEVYVNGFSSSLPADIQEKAIRSVRGLEKSKILRLGYAVEYDYFPPNQLKYTLETKSVENLYFAGQINGTSGYEEAAAQGLMAGLNAALKLKKTGHFILKRSDAYIGVLIDDLINKTHNEPYRMFTSRAEFRLLLRQDNADLRLMDHGRNYGLIDDKTYQQLETRRQEIQTIYKKELEKSIRPQIFNSTYEGKSSKIRQSMKIKDLVKRPELRLNDLLILAEGNSFQIDSVNEVEFAMKYDGYIQRQEELLEKFKKVESKQIPREIDYLHIKAISREAREKLDKIRPVSLGQASRISGVSPADLSVLIVYIEKHRMMNVPRETIK